MKEQLVWLMAMGNTCLDVSHICEGPDKKWEQWLSMLKPNIFLSVSIKLVLCTRAVTINWLESVIRDVAIRCEYINMWTPVSIYVHHEPDWCPVFKLWTGFMKPLCYSLSKYCKLRGEQKTYHSQQPQHTKQFSVKSETNHFEEGLDFIKKATKLGQKRGRL